MKGEHSHTDGPVSSAPPRRGVIGTDRDASPHVRFPNAMLLTPTAQLKALLTQLRDEKTPRATFIFTADRIIRLLVEEGEL